MKDTIRLFVAAILPPDVQNTLQQHLQPYTHPAIRFLPVQNLHLTLFFIGNVPQEQLTSITHRVQEVAQRHQPFILDLEQLEPGPNRRQPRLLWARFAANPTFEALSYELSAALAQQPAKKLKPIPHVTLARFKKDKPVPADLPVVELDAPLQLPVPEIALWQSELASPHPVYSVLKHFPLS
ncbi:RNA 2',3'-cyclic phosphodiesterase [Pontibacter akesuensis]|uniref:RNA 2',3'-cyclic phosphodiesterase n=1 Tax=Pontibacter akesuensis TaxID=388950 RepID=A0A1I7JWN4_9BACT|nr:RNA 2',3'-cyclic phosphodiesterase [Pontibacter akesuensis]GHA77103.1 RNA 2',3'-cyclic phosphodiesterase [Pontibacter akesuensis]SFU89546.1 2'-5' RNA ligase [Pontibacter akesuensis]